MKASAYTLMVLHAHLKYIENPIFSLENISVRG